MSNVEKLYFPSRFRTPLEQYLPDPHTPQPEGRPFVTLTYACSLDSKIAAAEGVQTILSGPMSKAMTHFLRTRHDAILVGSGTAITDNPGLNSRLSDALDAPGLTLQPRPVILDRRQRWQQYPNSKVVSLANEGRGKKPWIFVDPYISPFTHKSLPFTHEPNGRYYEHNLLGATLFSYHSLPDVLTILHEKGIRSVMIEGGATIINTLLQNHQDLVDSIIITYAPVYLGQGGVTVCPIKNFPDDAHAARFQDITWMQLERDAVMCGKLK